MSADVYVYASVSKVKSDEQAEKMESNREARNTTLPGAKSDLVLTFRCHSRTWLRYRE